MYLFFDTETTGLPNDWYAPVSDLDNWPRLVQIAFLIYDREGNKISGADYIIKPDGFTIPTDASQIHGISTEKANQYGIPILDVLEAFQKSIDQADVLIAHNINFDEKIVGAEFLRYNMENNFEHKVQICTMKSTTEFCAIEGPYGYKWPKLSELHYKLFGTDFEEAHNAAFDIQATTKCFWDLVRRGFYNDEIDEINLAIEDDEEVEEELSEEDPEMQRLEEAYGIKSFEALKDISDKLKMDFTSEFANNLYHIKNSYPDIGDLNYYNTREENNKLEVEILFVLQDLDSLVTHYFEENSEMKIQTLAIKLDSVINKFKIPSDTSRYIHKDVLKFSDELKHFLIMSIRQLVEFSDQYTEDLSLEEYNKEKKDIGFRDISLDDPDLDDINLESDDLPF